MRNRNKLQLSAPVHDQNVIFSIKGEIVFAHCEGFPWWPGKITKIIPEYGIYHISFINSKSTTKLEGEHLREFNQKNIQYFISLYQNATNKAEKAAHRSILVAIREKAKSIKNNNMAPQLKTAEKKKTSRKVVFPTEEPILIIETCKRQGNALQKLEEISHSLPLKREEITEKQPTLVESISIQKERKKEIEVKREKDSIEQNICFVKREEIQNEIDEKEKNNSFFELQTEIQPKILVSQQNFIKIEKKQSNVSKKKNVKVNHFVQEQSKLNGSHQRLNVIRKKKAAKKGKCKNEDVKVEEVSYHQKSCNEIMQSFKPLVKQVPKVEYWKGSYYQQYHIDLTDVKIGQMCEYDPYDLDNSYEDQIMYEGDYCKLIQGIPLQIQLLKHRNSYYKIKLIAKYVQLLHRHIKGIEPISKHRCLLTMKRKQILYALMESPEFCLSVLGQNEGILEDMVGFVMKFEEKSAEQRNYCHSEYYSIKSKLDIFSRQFLGGFNDFKQERKEQLSDLFTLFVKRNPIPRV